MFDFFLPFLYLFLFANVIYRMRFFAESPGRPFLMSIFVTKCLLSMLYWQLHVNTYGGGDTFFYHMDGEIIGQTLQLDRWKYVQLVFGANGGEVSANIAREVELMGYWHDTSDYMVVRFNALVYLFSFGSPYVHGIFMSFMSLTGLIALYRGITRVVSNSNLSLLRLGVFGIPSLLFWTSGVHKEGLLISGIGWFFYSLLSMGPGRRNLKYINMLVLSSLFIFLVRDFVFYLLLPGLIGYVLSRYNPRYVLLYFAGIYLFLVFAGPMFYVLPNGMNYLQLIAYKQSQFKALTGGETDIGLSDFTPTLAGLISQAPQSFYNVMIKPLSMGFQPFSHLLIFIDSLFFLLLLLTGLSFLDWRHFRVHPLLLWMKLYGLSLVLLTGFIVPNIGAIIRYRSIALPFLVVPLFYHCRPLLTERIQRLLRRL